MGSIKKLSDEGGQYVVIIRSTPNKSIEAHAGWVQDRVVGSHHIFKHPTVPGHITIPHPKKDLGTGLVHKIRKQAGLKTR